MNPDIDKKYDVNIAPVIGYIIHDIQTRASSERVNFVQQHLLHQGLKSSERKGEKLQKSGPAL